MEAIWGLLLILAGLLLHYRQKTETASSLLENQDSKRKQLEVDKSIVKDQATLDNEQEKRAAILKEAEDLIKKGMTHEEIVKFYTDDGSDPTKPR